MSDETLNALYDQYLPFRLYADFKTGASADDLAREFALPSIWVQERIEAMRLCLEKQVSIRDGIEGTATNALAGAGEQICRERIWRDQVWD